MSSGTSLHASTSFLPPFPSSLLLLHLASPYLFPSAFNDAASFLPRHPGLFRGVLWTCLMRRLHRCTACRPPVSRPSSPLCLAASVRPCAALHNNRAQIQLEPSTLCEGRGVAGKRMHFSLKEHTPPPLLLYPFGFLPFSLTFSPTSLLQHPVTLGNTAQIATLPPPPLCLCFSLSDSLDSFSLYSISTARSATGHMHASSSTFFLGVSQGKWLCFCMTEQLTQR